MENHDDGFELRIKAILGGDASSHVHLDDLAFSSECSSSSSDHAYCKPWEFACLSRDECVPGEFRCDSKFDCRDKSDESGCAEARGDCSFDGEQWKPQDCDWAQETDDELDWAGASSVDGGPDNGHDLNTGGRRSENYFVYAPAAAASQLGWTAALRTQAFPASTGICYVRFWYFMHSSDDQDEDVGKLSVYVRGNNNVRKVRRMCFVFGVLPVRLRSGFPRVSMGDWGRVQI